MRPRHIVAALLAVSLAVATLWPIAQSHAQSAAPADIEALIKLLEDDAARGRLIDQLRAAGEEAPPAPAGGARVLEAVSEAIGNLGERVAGLAGAIGDPRGIADWVTSQATDPERRRLWASVLLHLIAVVGGGLGASWLAGRALRPAVLRIEARAAPGWWTRAMLAALHFVLTAAPVAAFVAIAYALAAVLAPQEAVRVVLLSVATAVALAWLGTAAAGAVLAPLSPALRPVPLTDEQAAYAMVWARRLVNYGVYAYFLVQAATVLGLPDGGYLLLAKVLGLVFALLVIVLILQAREAVEAWIERVGGSDLRAVGVRMLRQQAADLWHVLAILYVAAVWMVWTLEIPGGFARIAQNTLSTALVVAGAWLAVTLASQGLRSVFSVRREIRARYPFVAERADRYFPVVRRLAATLLQAIAVLAVLQVWGLDVLGWLRTDVGRDLIGRAVNIAVIVVVAFGAWEAASIAIRIYLERIETDGPAVAHSQRVRTLLPLVRSALAVVIGLMTGLVVLSELGVTIGPLLAGAGVAGLAVGFGAQTLVKDFITGMFILIEDSIQVGDVARVAGKVGVVEALTVRTVRLRDLSGTVHTVPFSAVDTIENLTKEYSFAVIDIGVAYREDYDEVVAVLRSVGSELCADPQFARDILDPMEVMGLDEFADSAVVIRIRFRTKPLKQWGVRREFHRRVKAAFDAAGIEIPFPHQTIFFGADKNGDAPPLHYRPAGPPQATRARTAAPGTSEETPARSPGRSAGRGENDEDDSDAG